MAGDAQRLEADLFGGGRTRRGELEPERRGPGRGHRGVDRVHGEEDGITDDETSPVDHQLVDSGRRVR
jgi:hypothetical protein